VRKEKIEMNEAIDRCPESSSGSMGLLLIGQFVLGCGGDRAPAGWLSESIDNWSLGRHPKLPVMRLVGSDDRPLGWMLGYPISEAGTLLADGTALRVPSQALASNDALEAFIYSFGGRFALAWLDARQPRFYLDPCGSLSAIYCAHQRLLASTPNLIPYDERTADRVELAAAIGIPHTNGMYPLGLTPRHGVERILPNHYLDLSGWHTVRHWPKQPLTESADSQEAIAEIAEIVKRQIAAVAAVTPTYLFLTAGKDSRMLLACAKNLAERLELITLELGDETAAIDCDTAKRIAKRFGLKHRVLPMEKPTEDDLAEFMFRIAYSTGELRGLHSATAFKRLPGGRAILQGNGAELGTSFRMRRRFSEADVIEPKHLLDLCGCPPHVAAVERTGAWLSAVPAVGALKTIDMFFLEQRIGCWAGVWPYAECDAGFTLFPVCHRRVIWRMLTLPASHRRSNDQLSRDIMKREWPELTEWPINEPVGLSRFKLPARRAIRKGVAGIRHPRRAVSWILRARK
jgi:hypothetical protein